MELNGNISANAMSTSTTTKLRAKAAADSSPESNSVLLNAISPPFPLMSTSSFSGKSGSSITELLDLARKTPLPPSNQSSPLKNHTAFNNIALRATWSSRLSVTDHLLLSSSATGGAQLAANNANDYSRSHSTSPSRGRLVHFQIQDDSFTPAIRPTNSITSTSMGSSIPAASGLGVLNTHASLPSPTHVHVQATTNSHEYASASPDPASSISFSTSSPTKARIVHRSLSPASRTPHATNLSTRASTINSSRSSPIRPLSKARVPKGSPSVLVRAFDALTQSLLFFLGVAFLALEFAVAQARRVMAMGNSRTRTTSRHGRASSSYATTRGTSPRRNLHAKLATVALWPPLGLPWVLGLLYVLETRLGVVIGRAVFAGLLVALGPSYVGVVLAVSIPLAAVKMLSMRGAARAAPARPGSPPGQQQRASDGRGRKASRS